MTVFSNKLDKDARKIYCYDSLDGRDLERGGRIMFERKYLRTFLKGLSKKNKTENFSRHNQSLCRQTKPGSPEHKSQTSY
jgi:hypothetical protein